MGRNASAELGRRSEPAPSAARDKTPENNVPPYRVVDNEQDYFVERDGVRFAGLHLLLDLWGARNLNDPAAVEMALRDAALAADATILNVHLHHFSPSGGVSGVLVLAESHISIHTWPERDFAAIDIFVCGACDPYKAVPVLRRSFDAQSIQVTEQRRGMPR
jgi:S-adenosylmethionine decarboxylase